MIPSQTVTRPVEQTLSFSPTALVGRQLGDYDILAPLGQGGMGAVFCARHRALDKRCAVKVLPPAMLHDSASVARFRREARLAAGLEHPNVVPVTHFGVEDQIHYIVMRLVDGESLADRMERLGTLEAPEALFIAREAARGLAAAHQRGLVHRDIKPANILLSCSGEVLLADFGLARQTSGDSALTATGVIVGTPDYMSPEQCEGLRDIDARSDLFSLGLVIYAGLSGVVPAVGTTPLQILYNRVNTDITPIREVVKDIAPDLATLLDAVLTRDRDARLGDAEDLVRRIEQLGDFDPAFSLTDVPSGTASPQDETLLVPPPDSSKRTALKARLVSHEVASDDSPKLKARAVSRTEGEPEPKIVVRETAGRVEPTIKPAPVVIGSPVASTAAAPGVRAEAEAGERPAAAGPDAHSPGPLQLALIVFLALTGCCCLLTLLAQ